MSRVKLGQNELSPQILKMSHLSKHLQHAQYGNKLYFAISSSWFSLGLKSKMILLGTQVWKEWICRFVSTVQHKIIQGWWEPRVSELMDLEGSTRLCLPCLLSLVSAALRQVPELLLFGIQSALCKDSILPTGQASRKITQNCSLLSQESLKILTCLFSDIKPSWKLQECRTESRVARN